MKTLTTILIYGASDDIVGIEGHPDADEIDCFEQDVVIAVQDGTDGGAVVTMSYEKGGVWAAKVQQLGEDIPLPPCTLKMGGRGYSVEVALVVGTAAKLSWVKVEK